MPEEANLASAVESAFQTESAPSVAALPVQTTVETTTTESAKPAESPVSTETKPTEPAQPTETKPAQPVDPEVEKALNVYKLLNDPNTAPHVIKMLAEQLGIVQNQPAQTRQEPQKEPTIQEIMAAALGEEYAFLAPKIAQGLETVLGQRIQPIQQQLAQTAAANEFQTAVQKIDAATKGDFSKNEAKIVALMDEIKPGPNVPVEKYLNRLYQLVKGETPPPPATEQIKKVINKMETNAQAALPSPSAATENRVVKGPHLPSLDESIAAALRGEHFE